MKIHKSIQTLSAWPGGKAKFSKQIVKLFPPHSIYVEGFCGMLSILFEKSKAPLEVVNDKHRELVNFFTVIKYFPEELLERMKYDINSEYLYQFFTEIEPAELGDVDRAYRFIYLQRLAFGQRYGDTWAMSDGRRRTTSGSVVNNLKLVHRRLEQVNITCRDYKDLKTRSLDRPDSLWYLDPPYLHTTQDGYAGNMDVSAMKSFAKFARSLKGRVVVSHEVNVTVERLFKGWEVISLGKRQNSISRKSTAGTEELVFLNYMPVSERSSFI